MNLRFLTRRILFLTLAVALLLISAGSVYVISTRKAEQITERTYIKHRSDIDIFLCLIELSEATSKFMKAKFAFNKIDNNTNVDNFARAQINNFVSLEIKFYKLSQQLAAFARGNENIEKISLLVHNFGTISKTQADLVIMIYDDPNNMTLSAITARINNEFVSDWQELLSLSSKFVFDRNNFLNQAEKKEIYTRLLLGFGKDINHFIAVQKKEGDEAALKLQFYDGAWLPITIYIAINPINP